MPHPMPTSPSFTSITAWVIGTEDHTTQLSKFGLPGKPEVISLVTNSTLSPLRLMFDFREDVVEAHKL
jgi:hypothetical protein